MRSRNRHFLVLIPTWVMEFVVIYATGFGALGFLLHYVFIEVNEPGLAGDNLLILACLPIKLVIGLGVGFVMGIILGICDGLLISLITFDFIKHGNLWREPNVYRFMVHLFTILANCVLGVLLFGSTAWLLTISLIGMGTFLANENFLHWYFNYLRRHPRLFYELTGLDLAKVNEAKIWQEIRDLITYKMTPRIPTNLAQYHDGELPAEILRQFPIDRR